MNSKKSSGSRKDPLKTPKVWEKNRREKMKIYFNELQEVLPFYDPSSPMSRFEILQKSKSYIKDLQEQNQDLLNGGFDEVYKIKMTKLKQRVKELLKRVDQLTDLLRTANIMIPPLDAYPEGLKTSNTFNWMCQRPKKWTEKINLVVPDEKIKSVLTLIKDYKKNSGKVSNKKKVVNSITEKSENAEPCVKKTLVRKKKLLKKSSKVVNLKSTKTGGKLDKNDSFTGSQSPSQFKENQPVDFNLISNDETVVSKNGSCNQDSVISVEPNRDAAENFSQSAPPIVSVSKIVPQKLVETRHNIILPSTPNVVPSNTFILTNDGNLVQLPILNPSGSVFGASPNLLTPATIVKPNTGLLTPLIINKPSPVVVVQKPTPQIIQTAQIINTAPQVISVSQPSVQILEGSIVYTSSNSIATAKPLSHILSKAPANKKRIARDSTFTTYVNKIPIPALSKQSYAKKNATMNSVATGEKSENTKLKTPENSSVNGKENLDTVQNKETSESESQSQNDKESSRIIQKESESCPESETVSEGSLKRNLIDEKTESHKKQKLDDNSELNSDQNVFKPIENEADGMFCNLTLPNTLNPSLSVSPTAAFLSSFPIVAPTRSETDDEASERKPEENKESKPSSETLTMELDKPVDENALSKETTNLDISKQPLPVESAHNSQIQANLNKGKTNEPPAEQVKLSSNTSTVSNSSNKNNLGQHHIESCKSWDQFHQENCEIRSETFFLQSDSGVQNNNSSAPVETVASGIVSFSGVASTMVVPSYNSYAQNPTIKNSHISLQNTLNDQVALKANQFEYSQKENYVNKMSAYNNERSLMKKQCSSNVVDSFNVPKSQANFQIDSTPSYQLIPAKEVTNQRNARTVNWMTEPDIRNRGMVYSSQNDKMGPVKANQIQTENFYASNRNAKIPGDCSGQFLANERNKINYQKNEFYVKDQRFKPLEKQSDHKCYTKTSQNSYNIFDYNFTASCYNEDDTTKYCNVQSYSGKTKKTVSQPKKKLEEVHTVNSDHHTNDPTKRIHDQIVSNVDFNPITNQECFTWVPGKNVEWLPSKSFGLDSNLVVPSTLPTLVGDLALGTTSATDVNPTKALNSKLCQTNLKATSNDITKDYVDMGMGNTVTLAKSMESIDSNKQYLEPFANLSKNIFDLTPSNIQNAQMSKNDCEKVNFIGSNSNETIVLKNIFELPVSKSSGTEFSRNKQRPINSSQNTFLSVSQLVEPPAFEGNSMKNETQMDSAGSKDSYTQSYPNYNNNQKSYKNKARNSHCKYNDRKYHGYKNISSSYTAEALIRSNTNVNYQTNDFVPDLNTNYFNGKASQKPEQFHSNNKIDFDINMKSDFSANPNQSIYSDFNFSSPVPNFAIGATVGTEFGNHDATGNFPTQNNSFFSDFITSEYPLSDNVSNSLLLPPCSIALQNPFVIEKRNAPAEKNKTNSKQYSTSRSRKNYDCTKTTFNEFPIPSTSAIFTTSSLSCPTIFTTSACQNLLPVPTQNIPISFSSPPFTSSNISFPPLSSGTNTNYHRFPSGTQNSTAASFLPSNSMFTTCTSKPPLSSAQNCYSSNPLTSVTNSVISSPFPVGNVSFSSSSQSSIPFLSLSNPIIPSSAPISSGNSLANFNLSTIFPEINQKGNYQYS